MLSLFSLKRLKLLSHVVFLPLQGQSAVTQLPPGTLLVVEPPLEAGVMANIEGVPLQESLRWVGARAVVQVQLFLLLRVGVDEPIDGRIVKGENARA